MTLVNGQFQRDNLNYHVVGIAEHIYCRRQSIVQSEHFIENFLRSIGIDMLIHVDALVTRPDIFSCNEK